MFDSISSPGYFATLNRREICCARKEQVTQPFEVAKPNCTHKNRETNMDNEAFNMSIRQILKNSACTFSAGNRARHYVPPEMLLLGDYGYH